jgi:hypothetical protein
MINIFSKLQNAAGHSERTPKAFQNGRTALRALVGNSGEVNSLSGGEKSMVIAADSPQVTVIGDGYSIKLFEGENPSIIPFQALTKEERGEMEPYRSPETFSRSDDATPLSGTISNVRRLSRQIVRNNLNKFNKAVKESDPETKQTVTQEIHLHKMSRGGSAKNNPAWEDTRERGQSALPQKIKSVIQELVDSMAVNQWKKLTDHNRRAEFANEAILFLKSIPTEWRPKEYWKVLKLMSEIYKDAGIMSVSTAQSQTVKRTGVLKDLEPITIS